MSIWEAFGMGRHKGFSREAGLLLDEAVELAGSMGCARADTGHLLLAMLQTGRGTAVEFLRRKQITVTALSACASQRACTGRPLHLRGRDLAPESRKALEFAVLGAHAARVNKAENEHLLCAMLEDTACTASVWLAGLGLEVPRAARECRQLSGQLVLPSSPRMSSTRGSRPSEKYGRDLTRLAQEGQLDPVLCRDDELERMIEILCRRQKNNPCLLGEPGVGKSALAEALAQRIAAGQVTPSLKGKRVLALDMASMVAGTKYRGDFEERFKNLLEELYRDRSTILFIDEIHVIAGAGAAEGAIDAASILKDKLIRYLEQPKDQPFFAVLSVFPPHNPYLAPEQFAEGLCAENIKLRSNVPNVPWVKQQAQRELAGYYAMVRNLDWNVGRLVQALDKLNLADDTYIVFFSDHGDMHGSHGWFRKTNPYGESCRVPFIISTGHGCMYSVAPGLLYGANNACLCDAPLNHVDVAPPPWACAAWPCRIGCRGTIIPAM